MSVPMGPFSHNPSMISSWLLKKMFHRVSTDNCMQGKNLCWKSKVVACFIHNIYFKVLATVFVKWLHISVFPDHRDLKRNRCRLTEFTDLWGFDLFWSLKSIAIVLN